MRIKEEFLGIGIKAAAIAALGFVSLFASAQTARAQAPYISEITTPYGYKQNSPALLANSEYLVQGVNFGRDTAAVTINLEKKFVSGGVTYWIPQPKTNPISIGRDQFTGNIGNRPAGEYLLSVTIARQTSNKYYLLVVPAASKLETVGPGGAKPGQTGYLTGNMFPQIGTIVVLTPPANIAKYMGTKTIVPQYVDNFYIQYKIPDDAWEGIWKVHVIGIGAVTNSKDFAINPGVAPKYAVNLYSIKCNKESHDFSASDEIYCSMLSLAPFKNIGNMLQAGANGGDVHVDVDAGETIYESVGINFTGFKNNGIEWISDPSKAFYIIGLSECDQFTTSITGDWTWDPATPMNQWATQQAEGALNTTLYYKDNLGDSLLNSGNLPAIANWMKNELFNILNIGDDCLGVKILTYTEDEVNQARALNGTPLYKSLTYTGDSSKYTVTMQLVKIN